MAKYALKDKRNGKSWSFGNLVDGEKGQKVGLRVTPELRELLASKKDGEWINFLAFSDDRVTPQPVSHAVDNELPF